MRARAAAAKTLSQAPPVAWLEIAGELRPDLPDPERVHRKFAVHHDGAAYAPPEWARLWRLWLLREHAEAARPGAPSAERTARRAPGAFLDAAPVLFAGGDLSTSYEVLRNDR